jgi:hypothetical protein
MLGWVRLLVWHIHKLHRCRQMRVWGRGPKVLGFVALNIWTKQSLQLGRKMGNGNLGQRSLGPLGKSTTSISPAHLKVRVSQRNRSKLECQSFTKCVVFYVQITQVFWEAQKKGGATVEQRQSITRCDWKEHNQRMDSKKPNPKVEGIYHLIIHNLTNW